MRRKVIYKTQSRPTAGQDGATEVLVRWYLKDGTTNDVPVGTIQRRRSEPGYRAYRLSGQFVAAFDTKAQAGECLKRLADERDQNGESPQPDLLSIEELKRALVAAEQALSRARRAVGL